MRCRRRLNRVALVQESACSEDADDDGEVAEQDDCVDCSDEREDEDDVAVGMFETGEVENGDEERKEKREVREETAVKWIPPVDVVVE